MKRIICLVMIFLTVLTLSACQTEQAPKRYYFDEWLAAKEAEREREKEKEEEAQEDEDDTQSSQDGNESSNELEETVDEVEDTNDEVEDIPQQEEEPAENNFSSTGNGVINVALCQHEFANGGCSKCGISEERAEEVREALERCERYVTYLQSDADLLDSAVDLYLVGKNPKYFPQIAERIGEVYNHMLAIALICVEYPVELEELFEYCNQPMPVPTTSNLRGEIKGYARDARRVKVFYDIAVENWG